MLAYPLAGIVTLLAILLYIYMGVRVGRGRSKYGVAAPAVVGHPAFERDYRIQMNTLEWLTPFIASLWLFAFAWRSDIAAAVIGLVWILGRILYLVGYARAAEARRQGFLVQTAATAVLVLGALGRIVWVAVVRGG
ncbi:MAG: MAPEG family protein [Caulobacteraceae bacterium]